MRDTIKKIKEVILAVSKLIENLKRKDKGIYILAFVYMMMLVIYELTIAFFPKILLDIYINDYFKNALFFCIAIFVILSCFLGLANNYIRESVRARIGFLRVDYLADAFNKIITCDYKYMEDSSFFNKYDSAFDACSNKESGIEKVYNMLFEIPANLFAAIICSIIICFFSPLLIITIILHVVLVLIVNKKIAQYKYNIRESVSKVNRKKKYFNNITQDFKYGKDIRLYNIKNILINKYESEILKYKRIFKSIKNKEFLLNLFSCITLLLNDIVIYGSLIFKAYSGISIADITLYFLVITMLMEMIKNLITNISSIYEEGLYIVDFFCFIDANLNFENLEKIDLSDKKTSNIHFKNVSFKYPGADEYIYRNLNLKMNAGEKIAIVGENGVGKTTLVKLLVGLYKEFEGDILIDGISIKHLDIQNLFSVVFQDINLLAYSVAENIACKSCNCDIEKIWIALSKVEMKQKIRKIKKQLKHQIHKIIDEDGIEFSGGESQKLLIARALYKEGKILILDEPTSALDALAEKSIYKKFEEVTEHRTTIFISHRLASTKFCDKIYLIGKNGIIEKGTHDELMKIKGKYYNMFILQGKYYQEKVNEKN